VSRLFCSISGHCAAAVCYMIGQRALDSSVSDVSLKITPTLWIWWPQSNSPDSENGHFCQFWYGCLLKVLLICCCNHTVLVLTVSVSVCRVALPGLPQHSTHRCWSHWFRLSNIWRWNTHSSRRHQAVSCSRNCFRYIMYVLYSVAQCSVIM